MRTNRRGVKSFKKTYRSINGLVPFQTTALADAVMGPSKDNARAAPRHQAGLERVEKVPKVAGPRLGVLGRL